tara:strand:- start:775 stop:1455 length:681 start_codon:yes stop_codon:yes gene_type:complete
MNAGTLKGKVTGPPKPRKPINDIASDPICNASHSNGLPLSESYIIDSNGGLANALIWLENVDYKGSPPKEHKTLDQKGCIYIPHVMGIMKNQELHISNSDATMHNIHTKSDINPFFNEAQPLGTPPKVKKFEKSEAPFYVKCDVHPWMKSWVGVFNHPYYTVTNPDGTYSIDNIPEGTYDVVFWQEKLSRLPAEKYIIKSNKVTITINKEGVTNQDFAFSKPEKKN